jgi:hypothetical protein
MSKKPNITNITSGYNSTTEINQNFQALRDAFDNTVSLDGSLPNAMDADFDMNGYDILNAGGLTINGVDVFALINKTTISISPPSGGSDGDIWFKVTTA